MNANSAGAVAATSDYMPHLLYSQNTEQLIREFYALVSRGETTVQALAPILEQMRQHPIFEILLKNPNDMPARTCLRSYLTQQPHLPVEFFSKFMTVIQLKINVTPNSSSYANQAYNARVVMNNLRPPQKLTNLTVQTRCEQLHRDMKNIKPHTYVPQQRHPTIRLQFTNELLKRCINAMGDLHQTIQEGNRMNDIKIDDYIRSKVTTMSPSMPSNTTIL